MSTARNLAFLKTSNVLDRTGGDGMEARRRMSPHILALLVSFLSHSERFTTLDAFTVAETNTLVQFVL
jgi:hypothetical protein